MKYLFFIRYCTCNADGGLRQLKLNFTNKIAIKNLLILIFFEKKTEFSVLGSMRQFRHYRDCFAS